MSRSIVAPTFAVVVDGVGMTPGDARLLSHCSVRRILSAPAQSELVFVRSISEEPPIRGSAVGCSLVVMADTPALELFRGEITAIDEEYTEDRTIVTRIRSHDVLWRLGQRCPIRAHVSVSTEELIQACIAGSGLSLRMEDPGEQQDRILQHGRSDLEILCTYTRRLGLFFVVEESTVVCFRLGQRIGEHRLVLGDSVREGRVTRNLRRSVGGVTAIGFNPMTMLAEQGHAGAPDSAEQAVLVLGDLIVGHPNQTAAMANRHLDIRRREEQVISGNISGASRMKVGEMVYLEDREGKELGSGAITELEYTVSAEAGLMTHFSTIIRERDYCTATGPTTITIGTVIEIADPEGQGRVRVRLSALGDLETEWLQVASPGVGGGKGLLCIPSVADVVVVALRVSDAAEGIVLGSVFAAGAPAVAPVVSDRSVRYEFRTPEGQFIQCDDTKSAVTIASSRGHKVEVSDNGILLTSSSGTEASWRDGLVSLRSKEDVLIEAPGKTITVRAHAVNFEKMP